MTRAESMDALYDAAHDGDLARLRAALASGVGVETLVSESGWTPLHWAANNGHTACLQALLAAGASVHSVNTIGSTPLHHASIFGHVACVRALIAAGSDVNRASRHGWTPFSRALHYGHRRLLKILLRAGADDVNTQVADRREDNADSWALVDEIRAAGGWQNYVTRRRAALARAISDAFRGKFPEVIYTEIAPYMEAPGGDDD